MVFEKAQIPALDLSAAAQMGLAQAYLVVQRRSAVGAVVVVVTRIVDVVDYVSLAGLIQGRGYPQRQDDTIDNHKISVADAPSTNSFQSQLSRRLETRKTKFTNIYKQPDNNYQSSSSLLSLPRPWYLTKSHTPPLATSRAWDIL